MVFLHFPSNLTDEELMLQAKYSKLRKKKKALEQMKVPKIEVEKINPLKRPLDPKDAKELARKLIMSGKVALPTKQGDEKKTVFKRPRTLERKILATGRSEGHGGFTPGYNANYQTDFQFEPFTPAPEPSSPLSPVDKMHHHHHHTNNINNNSSRLGSGGNSSISSSASSNPTSSSSSSSSSAATSNTASATSTASNSPTKRNKFMSSGNNTPNKSMKDMGESYSNGDSRNSSHQSIKGLNKPKRGPTVYVQAHSISEEVLRQQFGKHGKIINIKLNNPTVGFVTFDKVESAEVAVQEMNGSSIDDISYDVQFARRQPNITQLISEASAPASWTAIANSHSQKSNHQDRRQQVVYDDPMEC